MPPKTADFVINEIIQSYYRDLVINFNQFYYDLKSASCPSTKYHRPKDVLKGWPSPQDVFSCQILSVVS